MATRKHPPRRVIIPVVLVLIAAAVFAWWRTQQPATTATGLSATGAVEAKEYQVAAAIAGSVTRVAVAEGQSVTKGQVLVQLDQSALKLQVDQATQGVNAAKAAVTNAKDDGTKADVAAANARLKQAQAAVALATVQRGYATIAAPHAGVVVSVTTNAGQNAAPGRTLLTISDPADLFVRVFVPEPSIGQVKVGQAAKASADTSGGGAGTSYQGTVSFIASQAEFTPANVETKEQRAKLVYEVRVKIADSSGVLKAGLPVDVDFS